MYLKCDSAKRVVEGKHKLKHNLASQKTWYRRKTSQICVVPNSPTWTMGKYVCRVALRNYRQKGRNSQEMRLRRTVPRPLKRKKLPGEALVTSFKTFAFRLFLRTCKAAPCLQELMRQHSRALTRRRRTLIISFSTGERGGGGRS